MLARLLVLLWGVNQIVLSCHLKHSNIHTFAGIGAWVQYPGRSISAPWAARQIAWHGDSKQQGRSSVGGRWTWRKDRAQVRIFCRWNHFIVTLVISFIRVLRLKDFLVGNSQSFDFWIFHSLLPCFFDSLFLQHLHRWQSEGPRFDSEAVPDMNDLEAGNHISNKSYVVNMEGGNATGANNSNAISRVRLGGIPLPGTELKT